MNNRPIKVLLAEDEKALCLIIKESLEMHNMMVDVHHEGLSVFKAFQTNKPDILILDIMMPYKDGLSVTKEVRKVDKETPIILLTARSLTSDVVTGFAAGCNDYIRKPFSVEELIVRVNALLLRSLAKEEDDKILEIGVYSFCPKRQVLLHNDQSSQLTHRESELLVMLYYKQNEVINRSEILQKLWQNDDFFTGRSLDVFITKLRKKLYHDKSIKIINVRGIGYKLVF